MTQSNYFPDSGNVLNAMIPNKSAVRGYYQYY